VPVVNENDTVSVDEIKFGDNDVLSALVAELCDADLLVLLTDQEGLYTSDPRKDPSAKLISLADDSVEALRAECSRIAAVERRRGYSLAGPHRDDLRWSRRGTPLASQASSGEISRTVALAKLAEWRAVERFGGEAPLFAADDFDAGLSEGWAAEFLERLPEGASILLTSAAPPSRFGRRVAAVLEVRSGHAAPPRALRAVTA